MWSSDQGFWLQIKRSRVRFPALPDFLELSLEQSSLSLVSTVQELRGRNSCGFGLENWNTAVGICCADILYLEKLALTSPTNGGCSVGIVCSQTKASVFF
jgi:hypothetical protein